MKRLPEAAAKILAALTTSSALAFLLPAQLAESKFVNCSAISFSAFSHSLMPFVASKHAVSVILLADNVEAC